MANHVRTRSVSLENETLSTTIKMPRNKYDFHNDKLINSINKLDGTECARYDVGEGYIGNNQPF